MSEYYNSSYFEVRSANLETARAMIEDNHCTHRIPNSKEYMYIHGLYKKDGLLGDSCYGVALWRPKSRAGILELSRFTMLDNESSGVSFLLGMSMRLIDHEKWPTLVTYSDSLIGYSGAILLATNWLSNNDTGEMDVYMDAKIIIIRYAGNLKNIYCEIHKNKLCKM